MNRSRLGLGAIGAVAAAMLLAAFAGASARATIKGPNGLIVYQAKPGKHVQLFTVRPDGTGVRQLTHFIDSDAVHAAWAPGGTAIAFERDFDDRALVYTMNADG